MPQFLFNSAYAARTSDSSTPSVPTHLLTSISFGKQVCPASDASIRTYFIPLAILAGLFDGIPISAAMRSAVLKPIRSILSQSMYGFFFIKSSAVLPNRLCMRSAVFTLIPYP